MKDLQRTAFAGNMIEKVINNKKTIANDTFFARLKQINEKMKEDNRTGKIGKIYNCRVNKYTDKKNFPKEDTRIMDLWTLMDSIGLDIAINLSSKSKIKYKIKEGKNKKNLIKYLKKNNLRYMEQIVDTKNNCLKSRSKFTGMRREWYSLLERSVYNEDFSDLDWSNKKNTNTNRKNNFNWEENKKLEYNFRNEETLVFTDGSLKLNQSGKKTAGSACLFSESLSLISSLTKKIFGKQTILRAEAEAAELAIVNSPKERNLCVISDNLTIVRTINKSKKFTIKELERSRIRNFIKIVEKEKKERKLNYGTKIRAVHIYSHWKEKENLAKRRNDTKKLENLKKNSEQLLKKLPYCTKKELNKGNNLADKLAVKATKKKEEEDSKLNFFHEKANFAILTKITKKNENAPLIGYNRGIIKKRFEKLRFKSALKSNNKRFIAWNKSNFDIKNSFSNFKNQDPKKSKKLDLLSIIRAKGCPVRSTLAEIKTINKVKSDLDGKIGNPPTNGHKKFNITYKHKMCTECLKKGILIKEDHEHIALSCPSYNRWRQKKIAKIKNLIEIDLKIKVDNEYKWWFHLYKKEEEKK